jgi:hypothetical protein
MPSPTIDRFRETANDQTRPDALRRVAMEAVAEIMTYREALFRVAPSYQGGHSADGGAIADALGLIFPVRFPELETKAKGEKMDPDVLWPWLAAQRKGRR